MLKNFSKKQMTFVIILKLVDHVPLAQKMLWKRYLLESLETLAISEKSSAKRWIWHQEPFHMFTDKTCLWVYKRYIRHPDTHLRYLRSNDWKTCCMLLAKFWLKKSSLWIRKFLPQNKNSKSRMPRCMLGHHTRPKQKFPEFKEVTTRVANITDFSVEVRNSENDPYFSRFLYEVPKFLDFLRILQFFDFFQHFLS